MSDVIETFESALQRVNSGVELVTADLQDAYKYISSRFIATTHGGGWPQFLQGDGLPSSTGTACITTSLVRLGISRRGPQLIAAADFLRAEQREDGGWSKPEFDEHLSLTLISCLSLHALAAVGITSGDPVSDHGLRWVENAQNPDGGWGQIARDERSDVTATAYALRALTVSEGAAEMFKGSLERGSDWMMRQQNSDGGWGIRSGESSTLAHTAHAVEGLLVCGYRREPHGLLADAYSWLLNKLPGSPLVPWVEHYYPPPVIAELLPRSLRSARLRWTHLPAERSLIALLKLGVEPDNEVIGPLVADLAERYEKGKCWRVQTMPEVIASWAILEAVNALRPYVETLEHVGYRAAFRGVIGQLIPRLTTLETQHQELKLKLDELSGQVARLSRPRHAWLVGLRRFVLAPATQLGAVIAAGIAITLLYLTVWSHGQDAGTKLIGVATIMVPTLTILELIRRKRTL